MVKSMKWCDKEYKRETDWSYHIEHLGHEFLYSTDRNVKIVGNLVGYENVVLNAYYIRKVCVIAWYRLLVQGNVTEKL